MQIVGKSIRHVVAGSLFVIFGSAIAADESFVEKAGKGGAAEVAAGNLARTRGSSPAVQQFGDQMVTDHTKAGDELKGIARQKGMSVPDSPDEKHQKAMADMQKKSGKDFDKAFKAQMVADHKATISLFEAEAKSGKDAELKAFAAKTLPDLKHHLQMAQAL